MARRMFYVEKGRRGEVEIRGEGAAHLRKVLRAEVGYQYEVSDNESLYLGEITALTRDVVTLRLLRPLDARPVVVRPQLLAALIKFDHFEWLLEKATELGVERITPVVAARTDTGLAEGAHKRSERWQRILFESGQQSRRVQRPVLDPVISFAAALRSEASVKLWLDERPEANPVLSSLPLQRHAGDAVALLVGPEGGWDEPEQQAASAAGWTAVSLGTQVLRAETAAVAAMAVISAAWHGASAAVRHE